MGWDDDMMVSLGSVEENEDIEDDVGVWSREG